MESWVPVKSDSDFSLQNLPYGIFSNRNRHDLTQNRRVGVAIGEYVVDLTTLAEARVFDGVGFHADVLRQSTLNQYASLGHKVHRDVRSLLQQLLKVDTLLGNVFRDNSELRGSALIPMQDVELHLPMNIGDYTDFFTSTNHAQNVSILPLSGVPIPNF